MRVDLVRGDLVRVDLVRGDLVGVDLVRVDLVTLSTKKKVIMIQLTCWHVWLLRKQAILLVFPWEHGSQLWFVQF